MSDSPRSASMAALGPEISFRRLFETMPDPVWVLVGNRFLMTNPAGLSAIGLTAPSYPLNLHPADISPPVQPDGEPSREKAERVLELARNGGLQRFEWTHLRRDGGLLSVEVTLNPCEWDGQAALCCVWRDVTERRQMEKRLRASDELLAAFIRHSPILSYIKEATATDSRVLMASDSFKDMLGIAGSDMAGKSMRQLFPPAFAEKIIADDWAVATSGRVLKLEEELNGRHYITVKFPIIQGEKTFLAGHTIETTEQKRVEAALRASESRYQRIAGTVPVMLYDYVLHSDGRERFVYVGPTCRDILGLDAEALEAKPGLFWNLIDPLDLSRLQEKNRRAFRENWNAFNEEVRIATPAGQKKWLQIASRPSTARIEGAIVWSGFILDVTERKRMERLESSRVHILERLARGAPLHELLAAIVHDIEAGNEGALCSILLLDRSGRRLRTGAAPSLPEFYNRAVDGIVIGPTAGSCGAAAFTGQRVIVDDIASHPNWTAYLALAQRAGLAACWSEPILASSGVVLGTFAIYRHSPGHPQPADLRLIEQFANLAAIAIERSRNQEELNRYRVLLEQQVRTDPLTGIANRRALDETADREWRRALRQGNSLALLMVDIDLFKAYNDRYGHLVGDDCLRRVARCLQDTLHRAEDFVARYGGEEFAVLLANTSREQALCCAERLRSSVLKLAIPHAGAPAGDRVSVSIGVGVSSPIRLQGPREAAGGARASATLADLFGMADAGLYLAKTSGRNRVGLKPAPAAPGD